MRLYIPSIGHRLRLIKPWSFTLHAETRNRGLWDALGLNAEVDGNPWNWGIGVEPVRVTLPKELVLTVERLYIRKAMEAFDSVTFRSDGVHPETRFRKRRFWAHLGDVNTMDVELVRAAL